MTTERSTRLRISPIAALTAILGLYAAEAAAQGNLAVTITSPTANSVVVGTIRVRAVTNVPADGVQFRLDGINLGVEDTTVPYEIDWNTTTTTNTGHTLTAVARGVLGTRTTSDPVPVTVANGPPPPTNSPAETRVEENDVAVLYSPGWFHRVDDRPFSGGSGADSTKADARATFTFTGTSVKWIGMRGPQMGIAFVYLDGSLVAQVDTYAPAEEMKAVIYRTEGLAQGTHRLMIQVTGQKNLASWSSAVILDAFDVGPASPPATFVSGRRVEETAGSVNYTAGWTQGDRTTAWSAATAATSRTAGAQATFTFTGTSVNWIGLRGPASGTARVFIDGTFRAEVDLYEPTRLQAVVFSASQLENTSHRLAIEVTGLHNASSTDSLVVVDAFDTRSRLEETHAAITYAATWEVTVSRAWSDKTAVFTWVPGAHATLTFTGTSVRWIGYHGSLGGIANVYLDGVLVARVDTYSAEDSGQVIDYEARGLTAGSHVLTIEATGEMNPLSSQAYLAVDAFDINF